MRRETLTTDAHAYEWPWPTARARPEQRLQGRPASPAESRGRPGRKRARARAHRNKKAKSRLTHCERTRAIDPSFRRRGSSFAFGRTIRVPQAVQVALAVLAALVALFCWHAQVEALPVEATADPALNYFSEFSSCADSIPHQVAPRVDARSAGDARSAAARGGAQQCGTAHRPLLDGVWRLADFRVVRRQVDSMTLARVMDAATRAQFLTTIDTIDGEVTHEVYIIKRGAKLHPELFRAARSIVPMITELVRVSMNCPDCDLCDVLIRRYLPGERRGVPGHYDSRAFATAVVTLNAAAFRGGYYVVHGGDSKASHLLCDGGDVLIHGYNLMHGVRVTSGARYALVAWFKPRRGLRFSDANPWLEELARGGDAEARRQLAAGLKTVARGR